MVSKLDEAVKTGIDEKEIEAGKTSVVKKKKKVKKLPKIKDIRIVSIDVGSKYIKIMEAKKKKDVIHITAAIKVEAPREVIDEQRKDLRNIPSIVNTIKGSFMKWHIATKDISFTSMSKGIISRELTILDNDEITPEERQMLVANELRQYLPINLEDFQIQFTDAGIINEDGINKRKVIVMAYPIKLIKAYLTVVSDMGNKIRPCSLDIANNSVQKFFRHVKTINGKSIERQKVHMIIDMGSSMFNTSIIEDDKLQFMKTIDTNQEDLDREVAYTIGKAIEDAEEAKWELCDLMNAELIGDQADLNKKFKRIIDIWIDEVARIGNFYRTKTGNRVEKIYIYGGGAKMKGLPEYMQAKLNTETEKINTFDGIELAKNVNIANLDQFINTIGTIIRF